MKIQIVDVLHKYEANNSSITDDELKSIREDFELTRKALELFNLHYSLSIRKDATILTVFPQTIELVDSKTLFYCVLNLCFNISFEFAPYPEDFIIVKAK